MKFNRSNPDDLKWLAGFFDGEGSVGLARNNTQALWRVPRVSLTQKDELDLLTDIKTHYGGSINTHVRTKNVFQWSLSGAEGAAKILEDILPYVKLQRKRDRIVVVLAIAKLMLEKSWHSTFANASEATVEDHSYRSALEDKFDELKEGEVN